MAITDLSGKKRKQAQAQGVKERNFARSQKSNGNVQAKKITYTKEKEAPVNAGGNFFAGAGYLGEKLAAGFVQTVEGAWDYLSGTATQAFGDLTNNQAARDAAYGIFNNQWWDGEFYQHADKWYNPDNGMTVAGDVAGGIGTSLPAIAANFANFAVPGLGTGLSIGVAGLGAAGNATSEAVQQTGSLDWSKIGYGAMVGATEGGIEYLSSKIGVGTGRIMKNISDTAVGKAASQLTKRGMFNLAKELGKDFVSEAAEEAVAEIMAPVYARMTYDPDAQFATPEQVWYAAFVGGMSGILMGGVGDAVNAAKSRVIGGNITKNQGEMDKVLRNASRIAELYDKGGIESDTMKSVSDTYQKLQASMAKSKDGKVTSYQKKLVGDLAQLNTAATFETYAAQRAYDIVQNIDAFVEKASAYKYTDPEGNPITVTKEALLKGVEIGKDGNINRKSLIKAIRNNRDLQFFALMDMAGRMQMDTAAFTKASMEGVTGANDLDIARYLEQASPEQKAQLASALGYETLDTVSADDFNARVAAYAGSSKYKTAKRIMEASEARRDDKADGKIPKRFSKKEDGTYVFESDGNKIAVTKEGETYSVYDYTSEEAVTDLSKTELNRMLGKYAETHAIKHSAETTTATETTEAKPKAKKTDAAVTADIEAFAKERVKGYSKLLPAEKTLVRRVIRQGKAMGIAYDILTAYANVCAHAKILVQFKRNLRTASGAKTNGWYDKNKNAIVVDPEATNGVGRVLIHELDHAIRTGAAKGGKDIVYFDVIEKLDEKTRKQITEAYSADVKPLSTKDDRLKNAVNEFNAGTRRQIDVATTFDEMNAYYAETVLTAEATVERLVADHPSLKDKILGFFSKAKTDYKDVPFLDKAAESYYKRYEKLFRKFAEKNAGGLVASVSEGKFKAIRPSNELGVKHNLAFAKDHRAKLEKQHKSYDLKEYDLAVEMFKGISEELDSAFLSEWNDKDGKRKPFKVFKDQMGYKHNVELSTECVKGVALFEAIDSIVQKQISKTVGDAGIHTAEKQLLYDLLQKRGFQIPCAICYVEQARQREGKIIENFLDGNEEKLGWNQTIDKIEKLMAADGHAYTFGNFNRMLATDAYSPEKAADMTDEQFEAFNKAFRTLANEYIDRENERRAQTNKKLLPRINSVTPSSVSKSLPATANLDIKLLRTFFLDPSLRMRIADDLLYSSLTTLNLATHHQKLYALFNQQGGQQTYKLKQAPIVYWGEILGKKKTPKDIRTEGSFRIQSNSDFQLYSFLDYVQMFVDLSAKGYSLHAYTKTLTQLKLFGLSGGKINASLIPRVKVYHHKNGEVDVEKTMENAGLDESGNPIYDDVEGIPHEETFMILEDSEYSRNCTGICIGYSDKHILKLLDDPHVQLIIGFHDTTNDTSKRYRGAKYSTNYNGFNEAVKVVSKDKFETVHLSFNEFVMQAEAALGYNVDTRKAKKESVEYNGKTYKADDIPRLAVAMYLQYCADHNMLPAYSRTGIDFSKHPNYYKLLGDYGLYDSQGHYAPQGAVSFKLPSKVPYLDANGKKAYQSTKAYIKEHLQGELAVRESLAKMLKDDGEGSFMDEYTKGAKAIRENGGRYAPKVEPQVNADTINIAPAGVKQSLPLSATKAVETFGTTSDVTKAGFVLPDGRMLNFERNGGVRHDRIAEVYDGVKGDAAVNAFIQEGNVRIKATAPGIELSSEHMPTVPQRNALNRFISRMLREKGRFYVDITDVNGRDVNTFEYDSEATAEDVMWDLRGYYGAESTEATDGVKHSLPLDINTEGMSEDAKIETQDVVSNLKRRRMSATYLTSYATYTSERMDREIKSSMARFSPDYAKSYITWVNPLDFLNATTTSDKEIEVIRQKAGELDVERLAAQEQTMYLHVDFETGEIVGHEGRHRMTALWKAGVENVAVIIDASYDDRKHTKPISIMHLKGQTFTYRSEDGEIYRRKGSDFFLHNMLPLSERFADAARQLFAFEGNKGVKFSLPLDGSGDSTFDPRAVLDKGTPRATGKANMTVAQLARVLANNTRMKVFSRQEALKIVNNFSASDLLTEKTRNELATQIWTLLNDAPDPDYREASIRNMAEFIAARIMTEAKYDNRNPDAVEDASYTVSNLHTYVQRVTFSDAYRQEIKSKVGEDGWRSIVSRWGLKKRFGAGTPMDVVMWDIVSEVKGFEGMAEMHPVDAFIEIDRRYSEALAVLRKDDITLWETMDDAQAEAFVEGIARDIRDAFMSGGNKSKLANILNNSADYYKARAEQRKHEFKELVNDIQYLCDKLKNLKSGALDNATQSAEHPFKASLETLANVKWRGRILTPKTIRKHFSDLYIWYTSDVTKQILGYKDDQNTGMYSPYIVSAMENILLSSKENQPLTVYDLELIKQIVSHAIAISENYNKVWKNGKLVDALPEAEKYIEVMHDTLAVKTMGAVSKLFQAYRASFNDPKAYMRYADKYMDGGFFTETFDSIRAASDSAAVAEMDLLKELDAFNDEHRSYVRETSEQKVKFRGQEIPKQTLITVYMTTKREHSWAGLALNGYQYRVGNAEFRLNPFTTEEDLTYDEMQAVIGQAQSEMEQLLTDVDKQYIAILEKGYLRAKEIKAKRDMARLGFTNAIEGYYVPLKRANMATTIDQQFLPINTASNSSFNKNTVKGAAQSLEILPADDLFRRHIHEVCQYAYLSPAIESFDVLWNLDTSGNRNNPRSLKTVYHSVNAAADIDAKGFRAEVRKRLDMESYFRDLIQDVQGTKRVKENPVISKMRGAYAVAGLGLNPKVWITQLSSLGASLSVLNAKSLASVIPTAKRLGFGKDVDLYCRLAEHRNYSNAAASAQAVMDLKTGKANEGFERFKEFVMHPIGKMDRFVVMMEFVACQNYIASHNAGNPDLALGTEQNKIEAGKLLTEVIHNTQQGSLATEKSAASRGGETEKLLTMFRSDQIKVDSRVISSFEEMLVKARAYRVMKNNPGKYSAEQINSAKKRCKAASKQFGKSMAALLTTATIMALVARWFRFRRNKEDENEWLKMLGEFIGNLFGGLPIFTDIYSYFVEGYDIDNFALSAINDLLGSISNIYTTIRKATEGTATLQDWMGGIKSVLFSFANFTGVPVRNVYNEITGWIRRISSGAGKKIDNAFYGTYAGEFKEAIERNDMSRAYAIIEILAGESLDGAESAVVDGFYDLNKRLLKQNKSIILPADCPASITVGGKKIEFTTAEQAKIQQRFASKAESDFKKLFASEAYKSMTAAQKRAAVAAINSARLHECIEYATNKDTGDTNILGAKAVTFSTFAQYKGIINGIESDKDKDGNTISGSKQAKVVAAIKKLKVSDEQKLFLIMVSGYTVKAGDFAGISEKSAKKRVASFIAGLSSLTKAEKEELAKKCGFEVKNGVIQTK